MSVTLKHRRKITFLITSLRKGIEKLAQAQADIDMFMFLFFGYLSKVFRSLIFPFEIQLDGLDVKLSSSAGDWPITV